LTIVCILLTGVCTKNGKVCVFPFTFQDKQHSKCIPAIAGRWCGTENETDGGWYSNTWDRCAQKCPETTTTEATTTTTTPTSKMSTTTFVSVSSDSKTLQQSEAGFSTTETPPAPSSAPATSTTRLARTTSSILTKTGQWKDQSTSKCKKANHKLRKVRSVVC